MPRSCCAAHPRYTRGCAGCREKAAAYQRLRHASVADGTWERAMAIPVEFDAARLHIQTLLAVSGITGHRVGRIAGVNRDLVLNIASGSLQKASRPVVQALAGVTAQACLALIDRPTTPVDAVGTKRRLQALAVDGWSPERIAGLVGVSASNVRKRRGHLYPEVTVRWRERYRELYDKIQSQADPSGGSRETSQYAELVGWLGPERWADEDIDNPDAQPLPPPPDTEDWEVVSRLVEGALRDPQPGKAADYPRSVQREIARQAVNRLGWSHGRIAELLGKSNGKMVSHLLYGRKDRPWVSDALRG